MGTHLASGLIEEDDGVVSKVDSGGHFELHDSSKEIMLLLEEGIKATLEKNPEGVLKLLAQLQSGSVVKSYGEADTQKLQVAYQSLFQTHTFSKGQLVKLYRLRRRT